MRLRITSVCGEGVMDLVCNSLSLGPYRSTRLALKFNLFRSMMALITGAKWSVQISVVLSICYPAWFT